jgi:hypothetical protein
MENSAEVSPAEWISPFTSATHSPNRSGSAWASTAERMQPPRADPEHLALVLGLLASTNKRVT